MHQDIIIRLNKSFPFDNYFRLGFDAHCNIFESATKFIPEGGKILDIGCGPCDKTAVFAYAGYDCTGYDDFQDPWHRQEGNFEKIRFFARDAGITLCEAKEGGLPFESNCFDMVMLNDIIEHLHESPRYILSEACHCLKSDGILLITVPNAVNIRKRISVLRGGTNYPPYDQFFWYNGKWRGHVREYVKSDLQQLADYMNLEVLELRPCDHMIGVLPNYVKPIYKALTNIAAGWKDSWLLICRKPEVWQKPIPPLNNSINVIH